MENILNNAKTIAVVGASASRGRPSNRAVRYLVENGYTVIPVNPNYDEIEGLTVYDSLLDIPPDVEVDIVTVFRNPRYTLEAVESAIERSRQTETSPVIWTQLGVSTSESQSAAREAGLDYVANRCIMVTHATEV